jgi:hypothetical protein
LSLVRRCAVCHTLHVVRRFLAVSGGLAARGSSCSFATAVVCALSVSSLFACGAAPTVDVGTEYGEAIAPPAQTAAAAPADVAVTPAPVGSLVEGGTTPVACEAAFEACGGRLAGTWTVEDTCNSETTSRKALQIWGQTFMGLDATACWDAVQGVSSKWTGQLVFDQGLASDERQRADTIEMDLSASCVSATFGVTVRPDQMPAVCGSLTDNSTSCSSTGGVCRCSSRRVNPQNATGVYGVLGTSVAIGPMGSPPAFYDYCVKDDQLIWRDPASARHLVLRRTAEAVSPVDPEYPR